MMMASFPIQGDLHFIAAVLQDLYKRTRHLVVEIK
jgi:hypothetical protein